MWNEVLEGLTVVKRTGQRVPFNASKIALAIKNAFDSVEENNNENESFLIFSKVLSYINENYRDRKTINVEDIQDVIEEELRKNNTVVYQAFSDYRKKRKASREAFDEKKQHKLVKAIEKIEETTKYNENEAISAYNTLNRFGRIISREYALTYNLDNKYVKASEDGYIFVHDLDYFSFGLLSHTNLLLNIDLSSDEPIDLILNEIIRAQDEVTNEIGINELDKLLKRYFINEYKKYIKTNFKKYFKICGFKELINMKRVENLVNNINSLNINKSLFNEINVNDVINNIINEALKDSYLELQNLINLTLKRILNNLNINAVRKTTFTISFLLEDSLINSILFEVLDEVEINKVNIVLKVNKKDPSILEEISKINFRDKHIYVLFTDIEKEQIEYFSDGIKMVGPNASGKMVVAKTSINLTRLALKEKSVNNFFKELDNYLELVKNELLFTFESIGNKNKYNYETLFHGNIYEDEKLEGNQHIRKVIKNGTLNIGLIGLKEAIIFLEKDEDKQIELLNKVLDTLNKKCNKYSSDTKLNIGIYEPSRVHPRTHVIKIDKAIYGHIKNVTDKEYYELVDTLNQVKNNPELKGKIQKKFSYGKLLSADYSKINNNKKILASLEELLNSGVEFIEIIGGSSNEY